MTQAKLLLLLAILCSMGGFITALRAARQGSFRPGRSNLLFMAAAFGLLCLFLARRGEVIRQCPLTNVFEVLTFAAWGLLGLFFLVGTSYRWSLLGLFTYPVVLSLLCTAILQSDAISAPPTTHDFWNELHKAVSVLSYGAFALAAAAAGMFLVQERQLKRRRLQDLFQGLPPLVNLEKAARRLMLLGLFLLLSGIAAAYLMENGRVAHALMPVWIVCGVYAALLVHSRMLGISGRRQAWGAILAFVVAVVCLVSITH